MAVTANATGHRRMSVGPVALLLGALTVFVLVHVGTAHDLVTTDVSAAGSHVHAGALSDAPDHDHLASVPNVLPDADPDHGHRPPGDGHHDGLVGCLVALTGLAGGLMLLRPRLLTALATAGVAATRLSRAVVGSRALRAPPAPSLATLCVLRT